MVIQDLLPAGVTFVSATATQGTYDSVTGLWTVGTLAEGVSRILTINVTVNDGHGGADDHEHGQCVRLWISTDLVPGNNSASVAVTVNGADLQVTKTVNDAAPKIGDNVTYLVTVRNNGPLAATAIVVTDLLPAGVTYVSHTAIDRARTPPARASGSWAT